MLLTITATPPAGADWPATDLGFLLHKNPDRVQEFSVTYGRAHVFYPVAEPQECTVALLLEVDPIALVRGRGRNSPDFALSQYVNDRPYAASSLLASALGHVFRTALRGRCDKRPELAATVLPLRIEVPALICRDPELAVALFEPLGWEVSAVPVPLDPAFPEWGASRYTKLTLTGTQRLSDALSHLFVLLAALDGAKHYWVASDEVDKLVRVGEGWLGTHPLRATIARRYLARRHPLVREALARLADVEEVEAESLDNAVGFEDLAEAASVEAEGTAEAEGVAEADGTARAEGAAEVGGVTEVPVAAEETETETDPKADSARERKQSLATARREAVVAALHEVDAGRVLDLGCGEGALLRDLLKDRAFSEVVGIDVSARALQMAARKLRVDRMPDRVKARLTLRQGALTYTDARLAGYDAAVLMEVIEHVDAHRLPALEHAVFRAAHPRAVVVTTPNAEYNVRYETLDAGRFRHSDHRFEWTRAEFRAWAEQVASDHGYEVRFKPVGEEDPEVGPSTQLALFTIAKTTTHAAADTATDTTANTTEEAPAHV